MAFEAFLAQDQLRPRRRRRITYAVSLALHGALLAVGIVYSFWHVDELSPPTVRVTFMSAAPPPPPPPPPPAGSAAAGGGEVKKRAPSKPRPTFTDLVQPKTIQPKKLEPKSAPKPDEPDDDDPDQTFAGGARGERGTKGGSVGGTIGGTIGGTAGGTIGGTTGAPVRETTKFLPPQMANSQKISGAEPDLPAVLRRTSLVYVVAAKICVSKTGSVDSVAITQGADSLLDRNVLAAVKTWRYRPFMSNNTAVPFCTLLRFEFKSE